MLIFGGVTECFMFSIPETLPTVVLINKAKRLRASGRPEFKDIKAPAEATDRKLKSIFRVALTRPWQILFDPISFFVAIYISVVYTLLYMLFTIYPIVFQQKRGWNPGVGELPLMGTSIGASIGAVIIFTVSSRDRKKMQAGVPKKAEDRLPVAMFGGCLFAATMFWFAWSAEYNSVHWFVPTLAGTFLSTSIMLIFVAFLNYLTDTYLMFTASAMAANTICRSACGASAPLFTQYMFDALGVGGGGSLIGGCAALLAPIPFIFYRYGEQIRVKSRFAPTAPKKPSDEEKQEEKDETKAGDAEPTEKAENDAPYHSSSTLGTESDIESSESSHIGVDKKDDLEKDEHDSIANEHHNDKELGLSRT